MYQFSGMAMINSFTESLEKMGWRIEKQLLKERAEVYKKTTQFTELKTQFEKNQLTIWMLKDEEVITWMDTLIIMRRVIINLFKKGMNGEKLVVIMEYPLVYGNHMRTDYLVIYDRLIIVLEFGMFNQEERRSEERYTKKLQDSISHRQVLANMIDTQVKLINYVLVYRPEYDRLNKFSYSENIEYNYREIELLASFIHKHIKEQDSLTAISQLESINIFT